MKNKTIDLILVFLILAFFTGYFLYKQTVYDDINKFDQLMGYAKNNQWEQALLVAKDINQEWQKHRLLISINYGEAEFFLFEEALSHLIAGSEAEELDTVLTDAKFSKRLWQYFNKVIPNP